MLHVQKEYHTAAHHYQFTVQLFSFLLAVGNHSNIVFYPQKYNYNDMQLLKTSPFVSFQHLLLQAEYTIYLPTGDSLQNQKNGRNIISAFASTLKSERKWDWFTVKNII